GSVFLTIATEVTRQTFGFPEVQNIVYGIALLLVVLKDTDSIPWDRAIHFYASDKAQEETANHPSSPDESTEASVSRAQS
ncbi:MAG: hypothetical protein ABEI52_08255, partial [Halobacteriaceae archaeon]